MAAEVLKKKKKKVYVKKNLYFCNMKIFYYIILALWAWLVYIILTSNQI